MPEERRRFERVECYMIVRRTEAETEEEDFFGLARNVSAGGALIETESRVRVGQVLAMAFLADEVRQVWETEGRVAWVRASGAKTVFGLEFTRPLEDDWHRRMK